MEESDGFRSAEGRRHAEIPEQKKKTRGDDSGSTGLKKDEKEVLYARKWDWSGAGNAALKKESTGAEGKKEENKREEDKSKESKTEENRGAESIKAASAPKADERAGRLRIEGDSRRSCSVRTGRAGLLKRTGPFAAALLLAGILAAGSLKVQAVTGTVTASTARVRSDASTSAGMVGQVDSGYSFKIGESKQDSEGYTWYQVTLDDGTTGYIRSDLVEVTADDPSAVSTESETQSEETVAASTADTQEEEASGPEVVDGYYIERGDDGSYYIVNDTTGLHMQIRALTDMKDELAANNALIAEAERSGRVWVILILIVLVVVIVIDVIFYQALRRVTGVSISKSLRRFIRRQRKKRRRRAAQKRNRQAKDENAQENSQGRSGRSKRTRGAGRPENAGAQEETAKRNTGEPEEKRIKR